MALRGTLEHMGLAAVLQLIGQNARHGVLTVEHGAEQLNLFFESGLLVRADGMGEAKEERVCDRLVAAQLLPGPWLHGALAQGLRGTPLQEAIAAQTAVTWDTLRRFAALHSTEAVYRAVGWAQGSYAFLPAKQPPHSSHAGLKTEHLLMEGLRAQDLWPALRARVPNLQTVYEVCRSLEDYLVTQSMQAQTTLKDDFADGFGFDDVGSSEAPVAPEPLSHTDRLIYGLVDGVRDVQTILDLSALPAVDAIQALATLLDAQLLRATSRAAPSEARRGTLVSAQAPAVWQWRFAHLAPLALRSALLAVGLGLVWWQPLAQVLRPTPPNAHFQPDTRARATWQALAPVLMDRLELVRAQTGSYPNGVPRGAALLDAAPLYAPQGAGYRLRRPLVPTAVH